MCKIAIAFVSLDGSKDKVVPFSPKTLIFLPIIKHMRETTFSDQHSGLYARFPSSGSGLTTELRSAHRDAATVIHLIRSTGSCISTLKKSDDMDRL